MQRDTWCHTPRSAPSSDKIYTAVEGDPGVVFKDTRELIAISMHKIQTLPVNKIKDELKNISADFNERTDPAYFKDLEEQISEAKALAAQDPENYDLDTMSFRELSGIRQGLNQTYDDTYADNGLDELAKKGVFKGPASADGRPPPRPPEPPKNPFEWTQR